MFEATPDPSRSGTPVWNEVPAGSAYIRDPSTAPVSPLLAVTRTLASAPATSAKPKLDRLPRADDVWSSWMTVAVASPSPIASEAAIPGIAKPNVPPNLSTYVRVETASRAGALG